MRPVRAQEAEDPFRDMPSPVPDMDSRDRETVMLSSVRAVPRDVHRLLRSPFITVFPRTGKSPAGRKTAPEGVTEDMNLRGTHPAEDVTEEAETTAGRPAVVRHLLAETLLPAKRALLRNS